MVTEFDPSAKEHLEELFQREKEKLDIDYTPDDSLWMLESNDNSANIVTRSYMKEMWYEELIAEGVVNGRVTIISGRKDS